MVEFALVLPLLLIVAYGIVEAGHLLFVYSSAMTSSREAARYGAAAGDIGGYVFRYQDCDGIRAAAKSLGSFAGVQDGDITISYDHGPGSGTNFASCPLAPEDVVNLGDRIIVQVGATYRPWFLPFVNFPSFPITAVTRRTIIKNVQVEGTPPSPVTPTVSFVLSDQSQLEGAGAMTAVLQLSAATDKAVVVPYSIDGTAENGVDYNISPGQVVFNPGDTLAEIVIDVIDDDIDEDNEAVVLTIGTPQHAVKGSPDVHLATIIDDDDPPTISFTLAEQSQPEVTSGVAVLTLSAVSSRDITVHLDAAGTAQRGVDFDISSGIVILPAGTANFPIIIGVTDDIMDEDDETIILSMGEVINATRTSPEQHQYTIVDNDLPPLVFFTWENQVVDEGVGRVAVEVQLSEPSAKDISVPLSVSGTATKGSDFDYDFAIYNIPAGEFTQSITVWILADGNGEEGDETIVINMLSPTNATKSSPSTHTVSITDEEVIPEVYFSSSGQSADESSGTVIVIVAASSAPSQDISMPVSLGGSAVQGEDYTVNSGAVAIPAGGATGQIRITLIDDGIDENNETIILTMGTPVNATKGIPDVHTVSILDEDSEPEVYLISSGETVPEDVGTVAITARLSVISGKNVTVSFSSNGSAEMGAGKDYTISSSPLTIPAGSSSGDILVSVNDDAVFEINEQAVISLGSATNATIGLPASYTLTIQDNEPVCPTADSSPTFGSTSDGNKLVWTLQSPNPLVVINLTAVTVSWPSGTDANVTAITFGSPVYTGNANPPYLSVTTPVPLWNGAFTTQQMIFKFNKNPKSVSGDFYQLTATFQGCPPISGVVPSD
jgi:Flp pilus assembly protein TadG